MTESSPERDETKMALQVSPTTSTFKDDMDIFDGIIEDIYDDLEAVPPPPPPSSKDDIEAPRLLKLPSPSPSMNTNQKHVAVANEDPVELRGDDFSFFCGIDPPGGNSPKLTNFLNRLGELMKIKQYHEMKDDNNTNETETPPKIRVMDNGKQTHDEVEIKQTFAEENDGSSTTCGRDTIIQHSIAEDEQKQKKSPSYWDFLGERKKFGVSYRIILFVFLNVLAFGLLIVLVTRFAGRGNDSNNTFGVDSLADGGSVNSNSTAFDNNNNNNNTTTATASVNPADTGIDVDAPSTEDEFSSPYNDDSNGSDSNNGSDNGSDVDNSNSELRSLCDEEGITLEDGVILTANQAIEKGEYFCSPSKTYMIGMLDDLAIINIIANEVVWSAGVTDGVRTIMQADGSLVIENEEGEILWNTKAIPSGNRFFSPQLVFWDDNNEGVIAIQQIPTIGVTTQTPSNYWMDGAPQFQYCDDCRLTTDDDLEFPVRGTFYFPTHDNTDESWRAGNGNLPMHLPSLGWYSSSNPDVATAHVEGMEYGNIDLAIASWEGPGTNYDRSRMTMLLEETSKQNAALKWTVYHEAERRGLPSPEEIQKDLEYLKKWFVWQTAWAHIDGKPVIYVNNDDDCDVAERWMTDAATDWYVVLRIFDGYEDCEYQPDSWHEQSVNDDNDGIDIEEGLYYNLAPGEWRAGRPRPDLKRLSGREWCDHVQDMVDSNEQWQLIVSFNEVGRGTSIEPSLDWRSDSPYGVYLDCLHDPQMF